MNAKTPIAAVVLLSIHLAGFSPALAQDIVTVSDISGGSSVFVFRKSASPPRRFAAKVKTARSKEQRVSTVRKIRQQYDTVVAAAPSRVRSTVVTPDKVPANIRTLTKEQASRLFAGVGEYYVDRGSLDNAVESFREAVTLNDKNTNAKKGLADVLAAKGSELMLQDKSLAAKAYFLEALKNDPKNAAAFFGLGEIFAELDQTADAIANYEKALAENPALTEIYQPLGVLYYQAGEIAKADSLLTKALQAAPDSADTQLFLGSIRLSQNRNEEALSAFQKARELDPSSADAANGIGDALVRLDRQKDAIAEYQRAIALRPNYFEAYSSLGSIYFELKNFKESVAAYQQAVRIRNTDADVYEALGDAQRQNGDYNSAAGSYRLASDFLSKTATASNDSKADVFSKLGFVIGRQCERNMRNAINCEWSSAITAFEKAVQFGGGNAADFANLGWAYYNAARIDLIDKRIEDARAKTELARTNLEKAVAANPPYIEGPLLNLGMTRTDLGDYAGAVDALSKVVKKQPKWAFAWNELGIAYRKQNKFKEAVEQYKKAVEVDENFAAAWYNMGEAAIAGGNIGDAKKAYQKLVKLGNKNFAGQLELMSKGAVRK